MPVDLFEIRADRPPPRLRRVARKSPSARASRELRAVGGNRHRRVEPERRSVAAGHEHADHPVAVMQRDRARARLRRSRRRRPRPPASSAVSRIGRAKRPPAHAVAVAADDADAGLAGDNHAGHRHSAVGHRANPQPAEQRERPGVERVATQLLAGEPRAIEQPHPRARARQHQRRNRARRARRRRSGRPSSCSAGTRRTSEPV